jgi:hypothetical protein
MQTSIDLYKTRARHWIWPAAVAVAVAVARCAFADDAAGKPPDLLADPIVQGKWILPAQDGPAKPIWGIKGGISVGLWPTLGPRGLIRIYAPYLGRPLEWPLNFVAVEPIAQQAAERRRGLSEIERSSLDRTRGKRMWTGNRLQRELRPGLPWNPAQPKLMTIDGAEAITFFVFVEPFDNGARPIVQVVLRQDRPYEVTFRTYAASGGRQMASCVLSATAGSYPRLRRLWLKDGIVEAKGLWPDFKLREPFFAGFAPHRQWPLAKLHSVDGQVIVATASDEADPARATYAKNTPAFWRYVGKPATQYWSAPVSEGLVARVNGRSTYWGSFADIPGGIAFENVELETPFREGQEFRLGVTTEKPSAVLEKGSGTHVE